MRAALFITCLGDTLFPGTGRAVVEVVERLGHEVDFPEEQTCCGQMHANSGYQLEAVPLVRRFVDAFGDADVVVSPSASCVGMVRHHYAEVARLGGDPGLEREVSALVPRVVELSEFIVDRLGLEDVGATFPHTVTYHPTCHSARLLHVGDRPLRLLSHVRGLELVDLPDSAECCGFGGTFAVKNADTSAAMLEDKLAHVTGTGADVCVSADNSCLMHMGGGLRRRGERVRTMHLAEVLAAVE